MSDIWSMIIRSCLLKDFPVPEHASVCDIWKSKLSKAFQFWVKTPKRLKGTVLILGHLFASVSFVVALNPVDLKCDNWWKPGPGWTEYGQLTPLGITSTGIFFETVDVLLTAAESLDLRIPSNTTAHFITPTDTRSTGGLRLNAREHHFRILPRSDH